MLHDPEHLQPWPLLDYGHEVFDCGLRAFKVAKRFYSRDFYGNSFVLFLSP